jgi:hypothetical protein
LGAVKNRKHLLKLERLVTAVLFSLVALKGPLTYSKLEHIMKEDIVEFILL